MKKLPVILLSLLLVSLLILGGLFFFTYKQKEADTKAENKTLQTDIASLQEQLQQKEDFISGQTDYINELTTQLADCQTTINDEDEAEDDEEYTSYLKEIVDRGHTIALHSYSHNYNKIYKSVDAFLEDFEKVYNWVYEENGVRPTLFRFPGGSTKGKKSVVNDIIAEMERRGFIYYDWNVSSGDGSNLATTENILENVCTNVGSFDQPVVLMHDGVGKNATLKDLPMLLETLAEEGYEFCSLDENLKPIQYKRK